MDMVLVVIPNNKNDTYAAVKKITLCNLPIPSQCLTATVLRKFATKGMMSLASKVAVQMACKLGGEPWAVKVPANNTVMVIGYDTWHDASQKNVSVGAVVATLNNTFTRMKSQCFMYRTSQENLEEMRSCIVKALGQYQEINLSLIHI